MKALTPQQELFAQTIASGKTQSEAFRTAYPRCLKWKEKSVWEKSSALASNVNVASRIAELQSHTAKRNEVELDEVIRELAKYLRFNVKSLVNSNGTMKSFDEMTDDESACIQSFEMTELWSGKGPDKRKIGELKRVKLVDKLGVADKFLRKFGVYATQPLLNKDDLESIRDVFRDIL
jgi:phage terminase small subunit